MKKKIKTWLILLLGGVTEGESRESDMNSAYVGAYVALTTIKEYADSLKRHSSRRMVQADVQADLQTIRFGHAWN